MYLRRIQWTLKIIFILFVLNQFQCVNCIRCGKFGFSCINKRYYRKCDVYKKSYVDHYVNLCPERTFCNEESKRACSSPTGAKKDDSLDNEINEIMSTQFKNNHQSNSISTTPTCTTNATCTTTTTTNTTPTSCSSSTTTTTTQRSCSSSPTVKSKNLKKPPSPMKATNNALKKKEKCKSNPSTKHNTKRKNKHSRDVWDFYKNEPSFTFQNQYRHLPKNEINTMNLNKRNKYSKKGSSLINDVSDYNDLFSNFVSKSEETDNTYNKNSRSQSANPTNLGKQFICPSVGSFPIESDDSCFYVCFNRRRSPNRSLKAIKVCCPKTMYFNKISHRCENRSSKYINWRRSRLRNRISRGRET